MNRKKILIIKTGSTFPALVSRLGDFDDWVISGMKLPKERFLTVSVFKNEALPSTDEISGIVIPGSHDMVTGMIGSKSKPETAWPICP